MILVKKNKLYSASNITEPKTIQELQRGFPDIRGLKSSYHLRWISEICSKRTLHRLLEHEKDHKTVAVQKGTKIEHLYWLVFFFHKIGNINSKIKW